MQNKDVGNLAKQQPKKFIYENCKVKKLTSIFEETIVVPASGLQGSFFLAAFQEF